MKDADGSIKGMSGAEFRAIRRRLGLNKNQFALELGYTGNTHNNVTQIARYEGERRLIPLYIARLAWLLDRLRALQEAGMLIGAFPVSWPAWEYRFDPERDDDVSKPKAARLPEPVR